ncbi:MAG: ASKHA domain-containing protein, partial [Thermoleophilia bacterium]
MSTADETDAGIEAGTPARVRLQFAPSGIDVKVPGGVTVFDAASWNGIAIDSTCGGHGTCRKCKVQVTGGEAPLSKLDSRAFTPDELRAGWRLACRITTTNDLELDVPPLQTRPKAATVGVGRQVILRPSIVKRFLQLEEATLSDQRTDIQRVYDAIDDLELHTTITVLRTLGKTLRSSNFEVTAVIADDELIAIEPGDTTSRRFAMAIDLGTTTVVANLLDLDTGTPVAVRSMLNKQQPFGADVISRISATMMDPDALAKLRDLAHETLAELTLEVLAAGDVSADEVYEVVLAGNATMTQIALGIDPEPLGVAPFVMTSEDYTGLRATDLGIEIHPNAPAHVFPSLGAYVGGDITAGILASGLDRDRRLRLFIDVGTNCEIAIGNQDRIVSTAAPAGPAFEAASIRCGMRAADGAIEVVKITETDVELGIIGDTEPVGMCGSGLVDAVAELVKIG